MGETMLHMHTDITPEMVGYDEQRIHVLDRLFEDLITKKQIISGNYCLARNGKIFANHAIGKLSFRKEDLRELKPDTIYQIASITKLFTTVAIWKLAEDGKLRVNQRVGEIIGEFEEKPFDEITIAHLLTHTSGLQADPGCFPNKYFLSPWEAIIENAKKHKESKQERESKAEKENKNATDRTDCEQQKSWIAAGLQSGMRKKAGEEWAYCSFGFVILGEIITRVSGEFAHDYIMEHIVKPCGLKDTGFHFNCKEKACRCNIPHEYAEKIILAISQGTYQEEEEDKIFHNIPNTEGGMYSTAYDLCRFGMMLEQKGIIDGTRIIGRKAVEKLSTLYTKSNIKDFCWSAGGDYRAYGLGPDMRWNEASLYSKGTFFHEGAGGCCVIIDPVEHMVAAWFVPYVNGKWSSEAINNVPAVMWSGLE